MFQVSSLIRQAQDASDFSRRMFLDLRKADVLLMQAAAKIDEARVALQLAERVLDRNPDAVPTNPPATPADPFLPSSSDGPYREGY